MDFISQDLDDYVVAHSQAEPELLQALNKETWQKVLNPRMLSGHYQGRVLSMLSKIINPKTVLEVGTYTGYSALCILEGLKEDGEIHTIDINEELFDLQRKYFDLSGEGHRIHQHLGTGADIIPNLNIKVDLAFIDADKKNYPNYFELILPKMNSGGIILSDNVLWSGKVIEKLDPEDADTKALVAYNKTLAEHPKLETVVLPIRDGLTLSRVK